MWFLHTTVAGTSRKVELKELQFTHQPRLKPYPEGELSAKTKVRNLSSTTKMAKLLQRIVMETILVRPEGNRTND